MAVVHLDAVTLGSPYALFDAATERFLPLGGVVSSYDLGDRVGGPARPGVACTRGTNSTGFVDILGDAASWSVDVAPPCTSYELSQDRTWLAAVPSNTGGCTVTEASRVKVRRLDGSVAPVEIPTAATATAFKLQPAAFSPDGSRLLIGVTRNKVDLGMLVADTQSGAVRELGAAGELVGWVNGHVALVAFADRLERVDVRSGERVKIRTASAVRAWCVSPAEPGTIVEIVDTLDGFNLAFLALDGTAIGETTTKHETPAACDKHRRDRFTSPGWFWQISRRSEIYAIDTVGKRLVEFPEVKGQLDSLSFSAGADGVAAVSASLADQRRWPTRRVGAGFSSLLVRPLASMSAGPAYVSRPRGHAWSWAWISGAVGAGWRSTPWQVGRRSGTLPL